MHVARCHNRGPTCAHQEFPRLSQDVVVDGHPSAAFLFLQTRIAELAHNARNDFSIACDGLPWATTRITGLTQGKREPRADHPSKPKTRSCTTSLHNFVAQLRCTTSCRTSMNLAPHLPRFQRQSGPERLRHAVRNRVLNILRQTVLCCAACRCTQLHFSVQKCVARHSSS